MNTADKIVYLTFDDGPTPIVTEWVLNELHKFEAKATFFCLGKNIEKFPELFEKIKAEGHQVGNHTYNHSNAWKVSSKTFINDVEKCNKLVNSKLFRPPYGKFTPKLNRVLSENYAVVLWDVISYDFDKNLSPEQCYINVVKHVKNGSIVVFHDSNKAYKNLKECLPKVLSYYAKKGFRFERL